MLGFKSMAYVVALARHGHFGEAADHLNITQSAMSQGIAALERQLGVRLFDRDRNGVRITAAGRLAVERAEALLTGEAELRRRLTLPSRQQAFYLSLAQTPFLHNKLLKLTPTARRCQLAAGRRPG